LKALNFIHQGYGIRTMKFLDKLMGKVPEEIPTWDIKPASERPVPKPRQSKAAVDAPVVKPKKEPNPFLDDAALDTMTLEVPSGPEDNPYATHTWEQDPENDTRKMRAIQIGDKTEKKPGGEFNPYDTGKMRRGWKK
jgi:hypothetical protein